jgi:hypothetical protein
MAKKSTWSKNAAFQQLKYYPWPETFSLSSLPFIHYTCSFNHRQSLCSSKTLEAEQVVAAGKLEWNKIKIRDERGFKVCSKASIEYGKGAPQAQLHQDMQVVACPQNPIPIKLIVDKVTTVR